MTNVLATSVVTLVILVSALEAADAPKGSGETAKSIEGVYSLYRWEDQGGMPIRKMAITARTEKEFSIRGLDEAWSGEGSIDGNNGYYHWVFVTGERGKSTFKINSDGTLKGEVRGEIEP